MKAYRKNKGEAPLILTATLEGGLWPTSSRGRFTPGKCVWYPLCRILYGLQMQSRISGEEKNFLSIPGFGTRTVQLVVY